MNFIKQISSLFSKKDKTILLFIAISTIFVSLLEILTISLTMVFISAILKFSNLNETPKLKYLFKYTGKLTNTQVITLLGSVLVCMYLFRCLLNLFYSYKKNSFIQRKKANVTTLFFENYLNSNYSDFASKNSTTTYKLIFLDAAVIMKIILSCINIFAESLTVFLIYLSLVVVNWKATIILTFLLTTKVILILKVFSKKLEYYGRKSIVHIQNILKVYNESFRNFKLIKLLNHEKNTINSFKKEWSNNIRYETVTAVLQETPRMFLETSAFGILIGTVIYVVYSVNSPEQIIPILSLYALAFYRIMPSISRIMNEYNSISHSKGTLDVNKNLMYKTEKIDNTKIEFEKYIEIKNLSFSYKKEKKVLDNVSLKINKGERVAFIGESGAGKSTIADIVMGFYLPKSGSIEVDGIKLTKENVYYWKNKIGYIPQQIYLFDGTVAENIVFGRKYDKEKTIKVLKKANIYNFLTSVGEDGIETKVGEGGIKLSGGQMQRIAIARALYSNPEILVLDEATSALDNETETNIMNEIYSLNLNKTLIIIAHRLSTILKCEKIYKIEDKKAINVDKKDLYNYHVRYNKTINNKQIE